MSAGKPSKIIKGRARLILTPTNLAAAYPYGGTELGLAHSVAFRFGSQWHTERAPEWGSAPVSKVWCGDWAVLAAVLREWDADAIPSIFPHATAGTSGQPTITYDVNATTRAGTKATARAILIVPIDSPQSQPCVYFPAGLPAVEESAAMQFGLRREQGIAVAWEAAPAADGRAYYVGLLEDLTL